MSTILFANLPKHQVIDLHGTDLLVLIVLAFFPLVVQSDWFGDIELGVSYDDNLNRSEKSRNIEEDTFYRVLASGGKAFFLSDNQIVTGKGHASYQKYDEFDGMDNWVAGVSLAYIKKFGLGMLTPRLKLAATAEYLDFRNNLRDSRRYRFDLGLSKRLSERWRVHSAVQYTIRRQDKNIVDPTFDTNVFDQERFGAYFDVDYTVTQTWLINVGYRFQVGDFHSTTAGIDPRFLRVGKAKTSDTVFGGDTVIYRLDAKTHLFVAGVSWAFADYGSFNFSYKRVMTDAKDGIHYDANVFYTHVLLSY